MPATRRLIAILATAVTVVAVMFITSLAQAPPRLPAAQGPIPQILQYYQPVTAERLKNPEPENWLMIRGTYNGWGYSPLNQITTSNVSRLKPVWGLLTGENLKVHEAAPIVNNGVMFISTPNNQVMAIDVKAGNTLWTYRRPRPQGSSVPHATSGTASHAATANRCRHADQR